MVVASLVHAGSMPCSLWGPSRGDDSGRAQGAPRTAAVPGMEQVVKLSCPPKLEAEGRGVQIRTALVGGENRLQQAWRLQLAAA